MGKNTDTSKQMYLHLINKTEDYIEQHLAEPISLSDLARNAHLSEFYFHRIFRKYSSETLHENEAIYVSRKSVYSLLQFFVQ